MYTDAGCSPTSCCNEFMSADNRHNYYVNYTHTNTQRKTFFLIFFFPGLLLSCSYSRPPASDGVEVCWGQEQGPAHHPRRDNPAVLPVLPKGRNMKVGYSAQG